jgi:hypothetical protein
MVAAPSLNVIVPVAVDGVTDAVSVTPLPNVDGLSEDALALLADGWELAGGVAVTSWPSMSIDGPNRTELLFLQSLVKTTHED